MPLMPNINYCSKHLMSPIRVSDLWLLFYGPVAGGALNGQNAGIFNHYMAQKCKRQQA
jgi:hypothetical protein